jgi:beta-mannanase
MNDPYRYPWGPHNNAPEDFVAAWRHINVLFKGAGADNVLWIWSPHPSYGMFEELYPGEYFVDYIGINVLNFGDVASWSAWWTFDQIIDKAYTTLSAYGKPMMISELGCLSVGGNRAEWYRGMMQSLPVKYPTVKVLLHFHYSED